MRSIRRFKFLTFLLFIFSLGFLFGCQETMKALPSACDEIQGPSLLCDLAAENNVNLTIIADGLGLANIIAIEKGLYTGEQAVGVLTGLRAFMENPVSYAAFKAELTDTVSQYPYLLQTVDRYVNQLVSTQIMYKEDRRLITGWLDRLIAGLSPG